MNASNDRGSRLYLISIVLAAVIGGLLFGYDTAVVSGAEQALSEFFSGAGDFSYSSWLHGFTVSSALIGCVIGGAVSGILASSMGRKRSLVIAAVLFFVSAVGSWCPESWILPHGEPSLAVLVLFNFYRIIGGIGVGAVIVIGVLLSFFQQAIGINVVLYYAPRIFSNMGASVDASMLQTVVMGIVNIVFTVVAIFTVDKIGRKPLLITGSIGMALGMTALSALSFTDTIGVAALVSIIVYTASFMMSWGPVCWVLISEIFPNTIRSQAVAISVAVQWISNFLVSSTFPSLSAWSVGGTYCIYAFMAVASAIFVYRWIPETRDKTLEDMSVLWKRK